jgi:hypothetical protein
MTVAARLILAWSLLVGTLAVVLWIWTSDRLPPSLISAVAFGSLLLAVYVQLRKPHEPEVRLVPDISLGPVLLGLGVATMLNGVALGLWLVYAGAGITALGVAVLAQELRASREVRR